LSPYKSDYIDFILINCVTQQVKDIHQIIADETDAITLQDDKEEASRKAAEERRKKAEIVNFLIYLMAGKLNCFDSSIALTESYC